MTTRVKMRFPIDTGDGVEIESMWVEPNETGLYKIDNIPFYATALACGDIVAGAAGVDGLDFERVVTSSGHSTLRILVRDEEAVTAIRERFRACGCDSEVADVKTLIAIDVPPDVAWKLVTDARVGLGSLVYDYEEAAISRTHVP